MIPGIVSASNCSVETTTLRYTTAKVSHAKFKLERKAKKYDLDSMLAQYDQTKHHHEIDFGPDVGRERVGLDDEISAEQSPTGGVGQSLRGSAAVAQR